MRRGFALIFIAAISSLLIAAKAPVSLEGYWKGSGTVSHGGTVDRVQCRVRYTPGGGGSFSYTATCAFAHWTPPYSDVQSLLSDIRAVTIHSIFTDRDWSRSALQEEPTARDLMP